MVKVNEHEHQRDDRIVETEFLIWPRNSSNEPELEPVHDIRVHVEGHDKTSARETENQVRPEIDIAQVLGIKKKIRQAIFDAYFLGNDPEHDQPYQ
jgi:hypothetical protein